jgi:hypothetical protein
MSSRLVLVGAAVFAGLALAGTEVVKNDTFGGTGSVYSGVSFGEYQGAGVLFTPDAGAYPLRIIGVDVFLTGYMGQSALTGSYELDLWDEDAGSLMPPSFGAPTGRINRQGVALTPSNTMFNRYTFPSPIVVNSGKVFVKLSQQTETSLDGTTIALDNATTPVPGANWFFDGFGNFVPFEQGDGGFYRGLNRNWIIRLVLEVPDRVVTVTSITPNSSRTNEAPMVVITGTNFELGAQALIGTTTLALNSVASQSVNATVPMGMLPGVYDVKVRNPNGVEGVLPAGYTVLASDGGVPTGGGAGGGSGGGAATGGGTGTGGGGGSTGTEALALVEITPAEAFAGDATTLFLTGAGFKTGASVLIGGTRIENALVESAGVITATLQPGVLTPAVYDVSVINLDGAKSTLPKAFTVRDGTRVKPGCSCNQVELFPLALLALVTLRRRRC